MHDKYVCHIFLSMSPEHIYYDRSYNLLSLYFIFHPQSTILSLYLVKSQLGVTIVTILVCLGLGYIHNFSKSLSHDTPHPLHNHSRSTSYVYKVFQHLLLC